MSDRSRVRRRRRRARGRRAFARASATTTPVAGDHPRLRPRRPRGRASTTRSRSRSPRCRAFPPATVVGHAGELIAGTLGGKSVVALAGRFHMYEGHDAALAGFPARVLHALGAPDAVRLERRGRRAPDLSQPGDLMLIRDHINLMFRNPLIGARGAGRRALPRHVRAVRRRAAERSRAHAAREQGIPLRKACTPACSARPTRRRPRCACSRCSAPTPSGMSTVPEVIVARAIGMRVLGVSCITNLACGISPTRPSRTPRCWRRRRWSAERFEVAGRSDCRRRALTATRRRPPPAVLPRAASAPAAALHARLELVERPASPSSASG